MTEREHEATGQQPERRDGRRPTEPPPSNFRPLWMLILFLAMVTGLIAVAVLVVDRVIYG